MGSYRYKSLPTVEHHIRLVKLHPLPPGSNDEDITCSISEWTLSTAPDYEALSYCWGGKEETTIICDGKTLNVPSSLAPFFLRTRAKGRERTLWIDSICINQADMDEKALQVREMHCVYQKANQTIIWLGPGSTSSTLGLEFAMWFAKMSIEPLEVKRTWRYRLNKSWKCSGLFLRQWSAFFELFERA